MTSRECVQCGLPMGYQKVGRPKPWQCQCGTNNEPCYRFCRACNTSVDYRVPSAFGPVNSKTKGQGKGSRMASYLAARPRCPLTPNPPLEDWGKGQRRQQPPIIWRLHGTSPPVHRGRREGQLIGVVPPQTRHDNAVEGVQHSKCTKRSCKTGRWQPRVASRCALALERQRPGSTALSKERSTSVPPSLTMENGLVQKRVLVRSAPESVDDGNAQGTGTVAQRVERPPGPGVHCPHPMLSPQ